MGERIPLAGPSITELEIGYVTEAAKTGWYNDANTWQTRFETAFAEWLGVDYAITVTHGTAALHLALAALGIGPGDEVIVPEATWIASAAPVSYLGATPVFADIDPETWCLCERSAEACLSRRTKALLPVDLYGSLPDMAALRGLADRHGLVVVEDAAEALGSVRDGALAGSFGDAAGFSFHGSKTLSTGEGGMLVMRDEALYRRALYLRDHGRPPGDRHYRNGEVAYKYKMSALQAACGLGQLERIAALVEKKREIFRWYEARLGGRSDLTLNAEPATVSNSYWLVTVIVSREAHPGLDSDAMMRHFDAHLIDTRPFFRPLSQIPAFYDLPGAAEARLRNRVAAEISARGINLPSALNLSEAQVDRVCRAFIDLLETWHGASD